MSDRDLACDSNPCTSCRCRRSTRRPSWSRRPAAKTAPWHVRARGCPEREAAVRRGIVRHRLSARLIEQQRGPIRAPTREPAAGEVAGALPRPAQRSETLARRPCSSCRPADDPEPGAAAELGQDQACRARSRRSSCRAGSSSNCDGPRNGCSGQPSATSIGATSSLAAGDRQRGHPCAEQTCATSGLHPHPLLPNSRARFQSLHHLGLLRREHQHDDALRGQASLAATCRRWCSSSRPGLGCSPSPADRSRCSVLGRTGDDLRARDDVRRSCCCSA